MKLPEEHILTDYEDDRLVLIPVQIWDVTFIHVVALQVIDSGWFRLLLIMVFTIQAVNINARFIKLNKVTTA